MRYLLLICQAEDVAELETPSGLEAVMKEFGSLTQELRANGNFVSSSRLARAEMATTVRVRAGKTMVTDGPFAETREQIGGYYEIEAKDLDEAISIAARIPSARFGSIEIRPIWTPGAA